MFANTLKTAAIATAIVLATAGASMASSWAWVDHDANVRKKAFAGSSVINYVYEGQKVKIIGEQGPWFKIQIPGKDGWVKKGVLEFGNPGPFPADYDYGYGGYGGYGGSFCIAGSNASFCLSGGY